MCILISFVHNFHDHQILCLVLVGVGIILRAYTSNIIEQSVKSSKHYMLYSAFVKIENVPKKLQFGELTNVR